MKKVFQSVSKQNEYQSKTVLNFDPTSIAKLGNVDVDLKNDFDLMHSLNLL